MSAPQKDDRPTLPAWLNPDVITEEMWARRPAILAATREVAEMIRDLRPRLVEILELTDVLQFVEPGSEVDDVMQVIEKVLGTTDLFDMLFWAGEQLNVSSSISPSPEESERLEALTAEVLAR